MPTYLLCADSRYMRYALNEISKAFGERMLHPKPIMQSITSVEIGAEYGQILDSIKSKQPIFVYNILPISSDIKISSISELINACERILPKSKTFKIEFVKHLSIIEGNAKSVEVEIGRELESLGFKVDLSSPQTLLFVVNLADRAILSCIDSSSAIDKVISYQRKMQNYDNKINRSEIKLSEAFEAFNINAIKGLCLDIGAAPGGWSNYMIRNGGKVVAFDNALMDYKNISGSKKYAIGEFKDNELQDCVKLVKYGDNIKDFDLMHIRSNSINIEEISKAFGKFDIVTIDANLAPANSATIAIECANVLNRNGIIIMTIKLINEAQINNLDKILDLLSKRYFNIRIKKLPHNREELTLFALTL